VKARRSHDPRYLEFEPADLGLEQAASSDGAEFPETLPLANAVLPLTYAYEPGQTEDGVTLKLDVAQAEALTQANLDWAVPGHLPGKVEFYVKALPKEVRRLLVPLAGTTDSLVQELRSSVADQSRSRRLTEVLAERIGERCGVNLDRRVWAERPLPVHLQVRVLVETSSGQTLVSSRDLAEVRRVLQQHHREASHHTKSAQPKWWRQACQVWEKERFEAWPSRELPLEVSLTTDEGAKVVTYPAVVAGEQGPRLKLHRDRGRARVEMQQGIRFALSHELRRDIGWMEKDLKALREVAPLAASFYSWSDLREDAFALLETALVDPDRFPPTGGKRTPEQFTAVVAQAKADSRRFVPQLVDELRIIFALRQQLMVAPEPYPNLQDDVFQLLGSRFLREISHARLSHLPRYLRARLQRLERWARDPAKDAEREQQVRPFVKAWVAAKPSAARDRLRWLIEEFRVSLWAQTLGTAEPVSPKKLKGVLGELSDGADRNPTAGKTVGQKPKPLTITPVRPAKKTKPLKSLDALGGLFRPPGS